METTRPASISSLANCVLFTLKQPRVLPFEYESLDKKKQNKEKDEIRATVNSRDGREQTGETDREK